MSVKGVHLWNRGIKNVYFTENLNNTNNNNKNKINNKYKPKHYCGENIRNFYS